MKYSKIFSVALLAMAFGMAQAQNDTTAIALENVVVTGTRAATDVRHLPMTVDVINREKLTADFRPNMLPTLTEQVPSLFTTARGMMGYGVSGGAAGGINFRGISGGAGQLLVLIDGHPQFQGVYGHPISDSYQTMMAERVEVLQALPRCFMAAMRWVASSISLRAACTVTVFARMSISVRFLGNVSG